MPVQDVLLNFSGNHVTVAPESRIIFLAELRGYLVAYVNQLTEVGIVKSVFGVVA